MTLVEVPTSTRVEVFREVFDAAPDAMIVVDRKGHIVLSNRIATLMFGYSEEELLGQSIELLVPARFRGTHVGERNAYHQNPRTRHMGSGQGLWAVRKDGKEFPVEISISPVLGGEYVCAAARDATEARRAANELLEAQQSAESANAAKSEFLSSVSHELRTPLNAVLGFAQLIERDKQTPLSPRQRERLGYVRKAGEHLLHLIDDILDLSRIESGNVAMSPEPVDIEDVMRMVRTTLEPMAERTGVSLTIEAPSPPLSVLADRTRFAQILMNYGSNAIKYGRSGTNVRVVAVQRADFVRVLVSDEGSGIPLDQQSKIFEPFHRAGQETGPIEGTGIGLAISRKLAQQMSGRVGFRSEEGKGSEFWVDLPSIDPRERPEPKPGVASPPSEPQLPEQGRHVVVYVEDNPANLAVMEDFVRDLPFIDLRTAPTAEIGLALIRTHRPSLVLLDLNLPGMSGLEARKHLRDGADTRDIPVIAVTAAVQEAAKHAKEFDRVVTKPIDFDRLGAILDEFLGHSDIP